MKQYISAMFKFNVFFGAGSYKLILRVGSVKLISSIGGFKTISVSCKQITGSVP
jgi:hypothetical protein